MKTMGTIGVAVALMAVTGSPGWCADSATVYNSGPLILAFLGLCALVVLAQFAPVAMLLVGLVKGVAEALTRGRAVAHKEPKA